MNRIAVDTGGTFCDFVLHNEETGEIRIVKVSSTPDDPSQAIIDGVERLMGADADPRTVRFFSHGTTVGTNALLEGTGARVGLLVTAGFSGIYEVREQSRGFGKAIYDLAYEKARPLVWPDMTEEVPERVGAGGEVVAPVDGQVCLAALDRLGKRGVESLAVVLLFSFLNPDHENTVRRLASQRCPGIGVSLSSEVLPQVREYYRLSTTVVNAYLAPVLSRYLERLQSRLQETRLAPDGIYVMQSNGGMASFAEAGKLAVTTALSGPAAGVGAALSIGARIGATQLITFDMGGTSCDVSLIHHGRPTITNRSKIAGYDVATPLVDIHTISAGGGTIAWLDAVGSLKVGPRSAGAEPGPVAYGRGGMEVTVTDCNLILGYLNPKLLDGALQLDLAAAHEAIGRRLAGPLGCSVIEAAQAVIRLINVSMEEAVKAISSQRGFDLRDFYLVAFGGCGPVHAARVAGNLGMRGVVVPRFPGVTSALGLLLVDVRHDFVRSRLKDWCQTSASEIAAMLGELREQGEAVLAREGFLPSNMAFETGVDLRYRGQGYELTVDLETWPSSPEDMRRIRAAFDDLHEERFGHRAPDAGVELIQVRLAALGLVEKPRADGPTLPGGGGPGPYARRQAFFPETGLCAVPLYRRSELTCGTRLAGPAIIEQYDTTVVVNPGLLVRLDEAMNLVMEGTGTKVPPTA